MKTIQQHRSYWAWHFAEFGIADSASSLNYAPVVKRMPARIHVNGLGPALAFLAAKGPTAAAERLVFDQLQFWLTDIADRAVVNPPVADWGASVSETCYVPPYASAAEGRRDSDYPIIHCIHDGDAASYRRATDEVLGLLACLKLYATALQKDHTDGDAETSSSTDDDHTGEP